MCSQYLPIIKSIYVRIKCFQNVTLKLKHVNCFGFFFLTIAPKISVTEEESPWFKYCSLNAEFSQSIKLICCSFKVSWKTLYVSLFKKKKKSKQITASYLTASPTNVWKHFSFKASLLFLINWNILTNN